MRRPSRTRDGVPARELLRGGQTRWARADDRDRIAVVRAAAG